MGRDKRENVAAKTALGYTLWNLFSQYRKWNTGCRRIIIALTGTYIASKRLQAGLATLFTIVSFHMCLSEK